MAFRILICVVLMMSIGSKVNAQVNRLTSGSICESAPVLCSIDSLDGFRGKLPDSLDSSYPEDYFLCIGEGEPNNLSWFAFVAGSDSISLTIIPSNCTKIVNGSVVNTGIQVGIYSSCDYKSTENRVTCATNCETQRADPVEVGASTFEIGKTYYLFVDGCAGSVCDYEVQVNYGKQPFEMPEFEKISNEFDIKVSNDTICAGAEVRFTLDNFDVKTQFDWTISPATSDYPTGKITVQDFNFIDLKFSDPGTFEVCVQADNGCDKNEKKCFDVVVDTIADEYFTPIEVCQGCFPIQLNASDTTCVIGTKGILTPSILTEDPNGDGNIGWLGTTPVVVDGLFKTTVAAQYGCTYDQYVDVTAIPNGASYDTTIYRCNGGFPFDFNGRSVTGPMEDFIVRLPNAAKSRCDSLISLTVIELGADASLTKGSCGNGGVELVLSLGSTLPNGTTVQYTWKDVSGAIIVDNDAIDSTRLMSASGQYTVDVELIVNGNSCTFTISETIDINANIPAEPTFGVLPQGDICNQSEFFQLYVNSTNSSVQHNWYLTPSTASYKEGVTSDTIYVDLRGISQLQYCVEAYDNCGTSPQTCHQFSISQAPSTNDIKVEGSYCADSIMTFSYDGDADISNATFDWQFQNGTVISNATINGPGPHEVRFDQTGAVNMRVTVGSCPAEIVNKTISIVSTQNPPTISCASTTNEITFTIEGINSIPYEVNVISGEYKDSTTQDNQITFLGIQQSTELEIEVVLDTKCGEIKTVESCSTTNCPDKDLDLVIDSGNSYCEGEVQDILIRPVFEGVDHTGGNWTGAAVDNGRFDVKQAGTGMYKFYYNIDEGGCIYIDSAFIEILPTPSISYTVTPAGCEDTTVTLQLSSTTSGDFFFENVQDADGRIENLESATYTARFVSENGCNVDTTITIAEPDAPSLSIKGALAITEGLDATYTLITNVDINTSTWRHNDQIVCSVPSCDSITITPADGDSVCVEVIYGDDCTMSICESIAVLKKTKVYVPNVFSPNGDGVNDYFYPVSNKSTLEVLRLTVFDRWGNAVFTKENATMSEDAVGWDGTFGGKLMEPGVFVYVIEYMDEEQVYTKVGDVTLIR